MWPVVPSICNLHQSVAAITELTFQQNNNSSNSCGTRLRDLEPIFIEAILAMASSVSSATAKVTNQL